MLPSCRLLVAIPLDREAFFESARADAQSFAALFRDARPGLTEWALWEAYEPLAVQARSVIADARAKGVIVVERPLVTDVHDAARNGAVVTLVAHWRSAEFRPADVHDVNQLAVAWTERAHPANAAMRTIFGECGFDKPPDAQALASRMNHVVIDVRAQTPALARARRLIAREYALVARRRLLQELLPAATAGGPAVEFSSGFEPLSNIVAGLSADCTCLFDLTICNSVLLGEEIRRKCRRAVVMMNADAAAPDVRLAVYRQIIRVMGKRHWSYQQAAMRLRAYLMEGVR